MKRYIAILLLSSCITTELQVDKKAGRVTDVEVLTRMGGDIKRITWLLDDRTLRYEYVDMSDSTRIGTADIFLVKR